MKERIIKVLERAKAKVKAGWIQGAAESQDGMRVCAAQAIGIAAYQVNKELAGSEMLDEGMQVQRSHDADTCNVFFLTAAQEQTNRGWGSIPDYNDWAGRTLEEILDCFDHAKKLVERGMSS